MLFTVLARLNQWMLPSFTRRHTDLTRGKKWQLALLMWRYYVTTRALSEKSAKQKKR